MGESTTVVEKRNIGVQVTTKNRDSMLAMMEECLRLNKIKINSKRTVDELLTFIINETGKIEADVGKHDDLIMSLSFPFFKVSSSISPRILKEPLPLLYPCLIISLPIMFPPVGKSGPGINFIN